MPVTSSAGETWPPLPLEPWKDTLATLHMWTQIVGKVCLALTPLESLLEHRVSHDGTGPHHAADDLARTDVDDLVRLRRPRARHSVLRRRHRANRARAAQRRRLLPVRHGRARTARRRRPDLADAGRGPESRPLRPRTPAHESYDPAWASAFWRALDVDEAGLRKFPLRIRRQMQPGPFLLGKLRSGRDAFFGPARAGKARGRRDDPRGVFSRGNQPRFLARGAATYPSRRSTPTRCRSPRDSRPPPIRPAAASWSTVFNEFLLPYEAVRSASISGGRI